MAHAADGTDMLELASLLETMVLDFRGVLTKEISSIRNRLRKQNAGPEESVKALGAIFKIIQGVELVNNGIRQQREDNSGREIEVEEFRRQLEEQIARLVDEKAAEDVS